MILKSYFIIRLTELVSPPSVIKSLSWARSVWPESLPEDSGLVQPEVQKYCLMGVKDSFTDFHIDFGGTSVWYHVLRVRIMKIENYSTMSADSILNL